MTASFKYTLIFLAGLITSLKLHEESHLKRLAVGEWSLTITHGDKKCRYLIGYVSLPISGLS